MKTLEPKKPSRGKKTQRIEPIKSNRYEADGFSIDPRHELHLNQIIDEMKDEHLQNVLRGFREIPVKEDDLTINPLSLYRSNPIKEQKNDHYHLPLHRFDSGPIIDAKYTPCSPTKTIKSPKTDDEKYPGCLVAIAILILVLLVIRYLL